MELASIIVNAGIFVATVIAAIIAWRGVVDAREAKDQASAHEAAALAHAEAAAGAAGRSAEAQQRAADALEETNRREAARDEARVPWTVSRQSTERWRVTNNTGNDISFVSFEASPPATIQMEDGLPFRDVGRGQPVFLRFGGGITNPASATVKVVWRDALGSGQEAVIVLG
ncbi:hypothetical protein [Microbacterium aurum]